MTLANAARKYLGVPFRHRGRTARHLDCVGLVVVACHDVGFDITHDKPHYGREPNNDGLREQLQKQFGEPAPDMQVGDVALVAYNTEIPHHVAIIGDYLYGGFSLIHADAVFGKVVEHRLDDKWQRLILETYRVNK
jgi:cell wall-associated NlpC family hydrolase